MQKSSIDVLMDYSLCLDDSSFPSLSPSRLNSLPDELNNSSSNQSTPTKFRSTKTITNNKNQTSTSSNAHFILTESNSTLINSKFYMANEDDDNVYNDASNGVIPLDDEFTRNKQEDDALFYDFSINNIDNSHLNKFNEEKANFNQSANTIDSETVKNKISSMWNNFKYGWATYLKKPNKINLDKSSPICILGKQFNLNNIIELENATTPTSNDTSIINKLSSSIFYDLGNESSIESYINNNNNNNNSYFQFKNEDEFSSLPTPTHLDSLTFDYDLVKERHKHLSTTELIQTNIELIKANLEQEINALLWFTYRKDFEPLNGNLKYTSDCGWGCMLRSAQMLLARGLLMSHFGKDWPIVYFKMRLDKQITSLNKNNNKEYNLYKEIVSWFNDRSSLNCPFGIHRLLKIADEKSIGTANSEYTASSSSGTNLNKSTRVGSWFGPTSVCLLLKEALNESKQNVPSLNGIEIYVAQDCTIYKQDVVNLCVKNDGKFTPCIVLISIRLGGEELNEIYVPSLKSFLSMSNCIGIIGGKPKHSLYLVGYQADKVIYLDPHFCQPTVNVYSSAEEVFDDRTFHCANPSKTAFTKLDPSLAIGFYCASLHDLNNLCDFVKETQNSNTLHAIFGINDDTYEKAQLSYQQLGIDVEQAIECCSKSAPADTDEFTLTSRPRTFTTLSNTTETAARNKPKTGQTTTSTNGYFSSITVPFTQRFYPRKNENALNNENSHKTKLFDKLMSSTGLTKNKQQQPRSASSSNSRGNANLPLSSRQKSFHKNKRKSHDQDDFVIV